MRARWLAVFLLLLPLAFAGYTVSVPYGGSASFSAELNAGTTEFLTVTVTDIPDAVSRMYVTYAGVEDHVFCAPSPADVSGSSVDFTCVLLSDDSYSGTLRFVALDENGSVLSDSTTLNLSVVVSERWYRTPVLATVGGRVSVGAHAVVVKSASLIAATLLYDGTPITTIVGEETALSDDVKVVFRAYDPDSRQVLLVFYTKTPMSVLAARKEYYLAAPEHLYSVDGHVKLIVATNCSLKYRLRTTDEWQSVPEDLVIDLNKGYVYLQCSENPDLTATISVDPAPVRVVTKKEPDPDYCRSHASEFCGSYCASAGYVKPPAGYKCEFVPVTSAPAGNINWPAVGLLLAVVAVLALLVAYKKGWIDLSRFRGGAPPEQSSGGQSEGVEPVEL